jgi:hypothetical protein
MWGDMTGEAFSLLIDKAYNEIVHYKSNLFGIPRGRAGTLFVQEITRLLEAYNHATAMECVAMKAIMVLPALMLQRPYPKAKAKTCSETLGGRLKKWQDGDIDQLLHECHTIQSRLRSSKNDNQGGGKMAQSFEKLVAVGNIKAALRLITEHDHGGCLSLDAIQPDGRSVKDHLLDKHPPSKPVDPTAISDMPPATAPHPIVFDQIDGPLIRSTVQQMSGSAGPSGLNAKEWKKLCSSFHRASDDLCQAIAKLTRRLCSTYVDPCGISPLIACRLIALDKCPGVRPIGVGETLRRLIGKVVLQIAKEDIVKVVGSRQLCAGQDAACEAGIHAMRGIFEDETTEAVLLVDASNAFNSLNRQVTLRNVRILCPILAPILINTYRGEAMLFIGGDHILSREGTTQGDPLAMIMYAIGTLPMICRMKEDVIQAWYADDASAGGALATLRKWWDKLVKIGEQYGYYPNASKTWLIVKEEHANAAEDHFRHTGIRMSIDGHRHLGAALGSRHFVNDFVRSKMAEWVTEVKNLSDVALTHPQAAYAVFTHGLTSKWTFIMRTVPNIEDEFQPLEDAIRCYFLPALTGRPCFSDTERELLALPARHRGLGILNPTKYAKSQFLSSSCVSTPLVSLICQGNSNYSEDIQAQQRQAKAMVRSENRKYAIDEAENVRAKLSGSEQLAMDQASEKGASSWLTTIPMAEYGFSLHKQAFRDALCVRYGWQPVRLPSHCSCGESFSVSHALGCSKGALPSIRHNKIRDLTAKLMTEVCPNVATEPVLQTLNGESFVHRTANTQDDARLDIKAQDFWDHSKRSAFFDVRVFNSHAPSNRKSSTAACYRKHELEKRRAYERRIIDVEHGTFTPLVMSTSGGWGPSATTAYKRLASLISTKISQPYSITMNFIRCKISFSLIDSLIMCLRGARSSFHCPDLNLHDQPLDLIVNECNVK